MARDLEEATYYVSHGGKIPVKWTAPEVKKSNNSSPATTICVLRLYTIRSTLQPVMCGVLGV